MTEKNEELYEKVMEAITKLFSNHSVSQSTARANLNELIGEINILLDVLEEGD